MTPSPAGQDYSHAVPFVEFFQELADDLDGLWVDGMPEREIDSRILAWVREQDFDAESYVRRSWPQALGCGSKMRPMRPSARSSRPYFVTWACRTVA